MTWRESDLAGFCRIGEYQSFIAKKIRKLIFAPAFLAGRRRRPPAKWALGGLGAQTVHENRAPSDFQKAS
jgi:hypothetical protein